MACACKKPRRPRSLGEGAKCTLRYRYKGGSLTRTSERYGSRDVTRDEALELVDYPYQLTMLENEACAMGKAGQYVSWGGKLTVTKKSK